MRLLLKLALFIGCLVISGLWYSCASGGATSAEEYYSIGMAYFEFGKFEEAEKWLNRARARDKTKSASEYNLGRIAYETGRYEDALKYFNGILKKDPRNVLAMKAAAYTYIKTGDLAKAEGLYKKVLALIPESTDDGFNYALVLFAMKKPEETEEVLQKYQLTLDDRSDSLLLLARAQAAQDKVEAVDTYHKWLLNNKDPRVHYEYAQLLEKGEFYTRALEEYRALLSALEEGAQTQSQTQNKNQNQSVKGPEAFRVRFDIARVLMIADPESEEGITELNLAVERGFSDTEALETLEQDKLISPAHQEEIRRIRNTLGKTAKPTDEESQDTEAEDQEAKQESTGETPGGETQKENEEGTK